jgi:hypothetical protein
MTSITVTFTLASGSLVVGPAPGVGNYCVTIAGITYPVFDYRIRYAADSDVHPGRTALAYTLEAGTLTIPLYAHASSAAALATMKANLEAACAYPGVIAVNQDGVTRTYTDRLPAAPVWEQDEGMAGVHLARATCVIPVNPI